MKIKAPKPRPKEPSPSRGMDVEGREPFGVRQILFPDPRTLGVITYFADGLRS